MTDRITHKHVQAACDDRLAIAKQFRTIAERFGADIEERHESKSDWCSAAIDMTFRLNGVGAMVSIDDLHGGYESIISWFNTSYPCRDFSAGFFTAIGEPGRGAHHKATSGGTWDMLAARLQAGLRHASRDTAFRL